MANVRAEKTGGAVPYTLVQYLTILPTIDI